MMVYPVTRAVLDKAWDKVPETLGLGVFLILGHCVRVKFVSCFFFVW